MGHPGFPDQRNWQPEITVLLIPVKPRKGGHNRHENDMINATTALIPTAPGLRSAMRAGVRLLNANPW